MAGLGHGVPSALALCLLIRAAPFWRLHSGRAVAPARTDTAGWAAELVAIAIADVTSSLLGPSVFGQLRALSAVSYDPFAGAAIKVPTHQSSRRMGADRRRRSRSWRRGRRCSERTALLRSSSERFF
jgi:hypothetical protein